MLARLARAVGAQAVAAALGLVLGVEAEVDQGVVGKRGGHQDVAAVTSIAAGGPAAGDELLAPEGHAAVATVAGLDANSGFIDEHWFHFQCKGCTGFPSTKRDCRFA